MKPVIRPTEEKAIRAAIKALRAIHVRGFVDYRFPEAGDTCEISDQLDKFLITYEWTMEAPLRELVSGG